MQILNNLEVVIDSHSIFDKLQKLLPYSIWIFSKTVLTHYLSKNIRALRKNVLHTWICNHT